MRTLTTTSCVAFCAAGPSWIWFEHRQWESTTADPEILAWAAREQRVVLSHDVNTMTAFAMKRLTLGDPMAGLFIVHQESAALSKIIDDILLLDDCSETDEWSGQIQYLPLR